MVMSKERWIAERQFLMEDVFEVGEHCQDCKHKISIPREDMSGEGHYMEPQRECSIEGDPDSCPGVEEEYYDGIYADRYFPVN